MNEIKKAAKVEWPFEDLFEPRARILYGTAEYNLYAGECESEFAKRLTRSIWRANDQYCEVRVQATYLDDLPFETYEFGREDYENMSE